MNFLKLVSYHYIFIFIPLRRFNLKQSSDQPEFSLFPNSTHTVTILMSTAMSVDQENKTNNYYLYLWYYTTFMLIYTGCHIYFVPFTWK